MPTPEERRTVIQAVGLCLNENCTGHDKVIDRILAFRDKAVEKTRFDDFMLYCATTHQKKGVPPC